MKSSSSKAGLYLHVPFCGEKCLYCDFYSMPLKSKRAYVSHPLIQDWIQALDREAKIVEWPTEDFDTLYFGGGTPSFLEPSDFDALFNRLQKRFSIQADAEITLEVNPDDVTVAKLEHWKVRGVNRLSFGVQSFKDEELEFLGRRHCREQTFQAIESARDLGYSNIGIDLIFGLPPLFGKSPLEMVQSLLREALLIHPEHISCYQLTYHEHTILGQRVKQGSLHPLGEEQERELFLAIHEMLCDHGYLHYEISNYASSEKFRSQHNQKYWNHTPYLGLGPSAHSFDGSKRWWNLSSVTKYIESLTSLPPKLPWADWEKLTEEQVWLENLMLGFRTSQGVSIDAMRLPEHLDIVQQLEKEGWVLQRDGRIIPTVAGMLIADRLPSFFEL